jgi:hypothetical protein
MSHLYLRSLGHIHRILTAEIVCWHRNSVKGQTTDKVQHKAVLLEGRGGLYDCGPSMLQQFLDIRFTVGGKVPYAPTNRPLSS